MPKTDTAWWQLPRSGKEARLIGSPRYFTGKRCCNGHIAPRRSNSLECLGCIREQRKLYRYLHPEMKTAENHRRMPKIIDTFNAWCARNPKRRAAYQQAYQRKYRPQYRIKKLQQEIEQLEALAARLKT